MFNRKMELLLLYRHIEEGLDFDKNYFYYDDIRNSWDVKSIIELKGDLINDTISLSHELMVTDNSAKRIVKECYNKRMLFNLSNDLKAHMNDYEKLATTFNSFELESTLETAKLDIKSIAEQRVQRMIDVADGKIQHGLMTNTCVDKLTNGFQNEYVLIGARPSVGKSVLGMQMAINVAKQGKKVAFFSLEMEKNSLVDRMLYHIANVNANLSREKQLGTDHRKKLADVASRIDKLAIDIYDGQHTIYDILAKVKRGNYDLIVIDYLQFIRPHRNGERRIVVEEISSELADLPGIIKCPVIAIASLSRPHEKNINKEPTMMDFKETSKLEFDADIALLIHRENDDGVYSDQAKIILAKSRNGMQAATMSRFRGGVYKFE